MAFFPRNFYHPAEVSFTPLFRLLDDFDSYSRQSNRGCNVRRQAATQWQPKFDVRETTEAYELHGELPGLNKENVHIEFSDPQTLVVRGKTERTYAAGTPPAAQVDKGPATPTTAASNEERRNSYQATVEDEDEASERESGYEVVASDDEIQSEEKDKKEPEEKPVDKAKYWLTERSVGEFARSFHFPTRVEQDTVTAAFQNGILSISVPKAKKHEARRININ